MSTDEPSRRPRRAEGAPKTADDSKRRTRVPWLWLLFAGLLLLNWILASVMMAQRPNPHRSALTCRAGLVTRGL